MKEFKVPQRSVASSLKLHDGTTLEGTLFVPAAGPHGSPGKLVDRLNDAAERFVPVAEEDRRELLHKECIVWARPEDAADAIPEVPPGSETHRVRITLSVGDRLEGTVHFVMRPERSRLLDYLNAAPRFIALDGAQPTLVNRRFIVRVEDLSSDPA